LDSFASNNVIENELPLLPGSANFFDDALWRSDGLYRTIWFTVTVWYAHHYHQAIYPPRPSPAP
jgi:hypothetical protein